MTVEEAKAQRKGYVLAEAAFGSDRDEANYRRALELEDKEELLRLDREASERVKRAERYLSEQGIK